MNKINVIEYKQGMRKTTLLKEAEKQYNTLKNHVLDNKLEINNHLWNEALEELNWMQRMIRNKKCTTYSFHASYEYMILSLNKIIDKLEG